MLVDRHGLYPPIEIGGISPVTVLKTEDCYVTNNLLHFYYNIYNNIYYVFVIRKEGLFALKQRKDKADFALSPSLSFWWAH